MKTGVLFVLAISFLLASLSTRAETPVDLRIDEMPDAIRVVTANGLELVRYQLTKPTTGAAASESACYFHPVATPSGTIVTALAPSDHKHHRGIFLGWVEMHGRKDADFWGWGEHAPTAGRKIIHRALKDVNTANGEAHFTAQNEWLAENESLLGEELRAVVRVTKAGTVLDVTYRLTPTDDIALAQWAFSGFCARVRTDGRPTIMAASGKPTLPAPSHLKPESDWPDEPWYDLSTALSDGKSVGLAVINHPENPPTRWHNIAAITMLNPCIVAPAAMQLKSGQPLVLRYRIVAHDGDPNKTALNELAAEFRK